MTGLQLSMRAGMDQSYLSKLERGKAGYSPEGLEAIAKALGVPLAELFGVGNVQPEAMPSGFSHPDAGLCSGRTARRDSVKLPE